MRTGEWEVNVVDLSKEIDRMLYASNFPTVWSKNGEALAEELMQDVDSDTDLDIGVLVARYIVAAYNRDVASLMRAVASGVRMNLVAIALAEAIVKKADSENMDGNRIIEYIDNMLEEGSVTDLNPNILDLVG